MGTITPTESRAISDEIVAAGGPSEAPVLGSIPEAKAGKLIVMVGGSTEQFHRWSELLQNFSSEPVLIGPSELPLSNCVESTNCSLSAAFALSLGFVQHQGIDIDLFMNPSGQCPMPPRLTKVAADARPQLCRRQLSD